MSMSSPGNALVEQKTFLSLGQQAVSLRDSHDRLKALRRVTSTAQILLAYSMVMRALSQTASRYVCPELYWHFCFHDISVISRVSLYLHLQCISVQPVQRIRVSGSGRYPYPCSFNDTSCRGQGSYLCGQTTRCEGDDNRAQQLNVLELPLISYR